MPRLGGTGAEARSLYPIWDYVYQTIWRRRFALPVEASPLCDRRRSER
jgi:hypothetical protein